MALNWEKLKSETAHNGNNEISQVIACSASAMSVCSVIALSFATDFLYVNLNILSVSET